MLNQSSTEFLTQFAATSQGERVLSGCLHLPPAALIPSIGVVVCPPFGYEAICSHRALRAFSMQFAQLGMPTLRFDYHGTGDSVGDDLQPQRVEAWIASIAAAVEHLRHSAKVDQIALVGVRLGALLAMAFASRRSDIAAVVAVAPVVSGRAYIRELKILQTSLQLNPDPNAKNLPLTTANREALGFALSEQTVVSLSTMDAADLPCVAPALLIVDRTDLGNTKGLAAIQQSKGATVTRQAVDGYVEMMLDPHKMKTPVAMLQATCDWLQALSPTSASMPGVTFDDQNSSALLTAATTWTESNCIVDSRMPLAAVTTQTNIKSADHAVLMLNAGAVHHIGPNRLYVRLARQLAVHGVASMRIDLAGIGDSSALLSRDENNVYAAGAVADVRAAVRVLRQTYRRVSVLGLCSGAYHALKTAVAGENFEHVVMINPLVFFWRDGMSLDSTESHVVADAQQYAASLKSADKWKKLFRGDVNLRHVAHVVAQRAIQRGRFAVRDVARHVGVKVGDEDLGFDIQQIVKRGDKLHWIFADSDPGHELLVEQGGTVIEKLQKAGRLSVDVINGADHTFTALWTHPLLLSCVLKCLEIRQ
jgi:pimeloyl-ACP methyl ester carboxylesterase